MSLRPLHTTDGADSLGRAVGPEPEPARTCANGQDLSEDRARGRAEAKQIARAAAQEHLGILGVGRALGLSDSAGRKLCDSTDPLPLALGDVIAVGRSAAEGGREWAELVLTEALAAVRGEGMPTPVSLERMQRLIARDAGVFADVLDKALGDNRVSPDEARDLLRIVRQMRRHVDEIAEKLEGLIS